MRSLNVLLKNASLLLVSNLATKGLSALFIVFLARYLQDYGFGQYNFALSFAAVFIIFADMGLDALVIKNVARDRTLAGEYLESVGTLRVGLSILMIAMSLLAGAIMGIGGYLLLVVLAAGLAYMFDKISGLFYALFRAHERMEFEASVQILWRVVQVSLGLGAIYFGFSLLGIMSVLLVSSAIKVIVGYSLVAHLGVIPEKKTLTHKQTLASAYPFAAYEIGNAIYMNISIIILFLLTTPEDTGWFSAALRIILFMLLVPSAFDAAIYPVFSRLYSSSSADMNFAYSKSIKFSLAAAIPAGITIAVLSEELAAVFGTGFGNTGHCLFVLAALLPLYTMNMLMKSALWGADAQHKIAHNIWMALAILAAATYILVVRDGYLGAAWALVIGESSFFALNMIWIGKKRLPMSRHLWKPLAAGFGMAGTAYILWLFADGSMSNIHIALFSALAYSGIILGLGFITKTDRKLFNEALSRRKH